MHIDLQRHGVIEASAGTGKTYTLEQLVLRLLTETDVRLEQILLVTYTEKATGELKGRIRQALERQSVERPEHRPRMQAALDAFDQAHVYTIHGFCQRALQEYALENRHELRVQLVNDRDLLETCLREIQRKHWRADYGERLGDVLDLAGYSGRPGGPAAWEALVQRLALSYRPGCDHILRPALLDNWPAALWQREEEARASLCRWRELAGPCGPGGVKTHRWSVGFLQLEFNPQHRGSRHDSLLVPLLTLLFEPAANSKPLHALQQFMQYSQEASSFDRYGFRLLTEHSSAKAQAQLDDLCPNLRQVVDELEAVREDRAGMALQHQLAVRTILHLQDALSAYKRERGLQSFEDMLTRLEASLDPERSSQAHALQRHLRGQFRYAIVDEFQDTDPIQWKIFKRIFVEEAGQHRLFVVGDPKQAIFAFRGADVQAYLDATEELKHRFQAATYPLDTNWRSCPELIQMLNDLFEKSGWFSNTNIEFRAAVWPEPGEQRNIIAADETQRPALCAVDLTESDALVPARRQYARFIAGEIRPLLGNMTIRRKGDEQPRRLHAGDVCVLVYKRREANPIVAALRAAEIPYTFYKQPGLWHSDEAIHVDYLLRALSQPEDTAAFYRLLLTRFFDVRPEELARCEQLPPAHEARRLFDRWLESAERRDWAQLFRSVIDDTGVLLRELRQADAERRLANFRHILQTLEQEAYRQDLDLVGVLEVLRDRRGHGGESDSDVQPIETEQPKVQIMTVHASKGLEFPVVFLAGGFTVGRKNGCRTYRDDANKLVFDLCPDNPAKARADLEQDHEDRRLLYVALTRAIFKLYVPKVDAQKKYAARGPVATILAPALVAAETETIPCSNTSRFDILHSIFEVNEPDSGVTAISNIECRMSNVELRRHIGADELFPQLPADLARRRIVIRSFSSLHRDSPFQPLETPTFGDKTPRTEDEEPGVAPAEDSLRGTGFGSLIHDVLEEIRFEEVGAASAPEMLLHERAAACRVIDERVDWYLPELRARLREDELRALCRRQVAQLVWNTLHTPLAAVGDVLWRVPACDRLHELEFHFPEWEGSTPAEVARAEGFFTGFIDLVFRRNGKYFLVDWKTNLLPAYGPQEIAHSMRESEYHRQYGLYLQALARWFKRVHSGRFDGQRDFGGVYYLYVRGMNAKDESTGVFFQPSPMRHAETGV